MSGDGMTHDMAPAEPTASDALHAALRAAIDETRAASSAWRPAVAAYLFDAGLAPLHAALAAQGRSTPGSSRPPGG
ncbi:MAG: hypothetical protein H6701_12770 [Myxococcales bacterium]|nr:hypothetical protein [Myxococcales bacterium]